MDLQIAEVNPQSQNDSHVESITPSRHGHTFLLDFDVLCLFCRIGHQVGHHGDRFRHPASPWI